MLVRLACLLVFAFPALASRPAHPLVSTQKEPSAERLDINQATVADLTELPGIGPVLAQRIVDHRRRYGGFRRPQDVIIVRGMSARRYRRIANLIRT